MDIREQAYNIFNADGKLIQVEYGLEAVYNSYQVVSVVSKDSIICVSKRVPRPILRVDEHTSIYKIAENIYFNITGMPADIAYVVNRSRALAASKEYALGCKLVPDIFARDLSDKFQILIQKSGKRLPAFATSVFGFDGETPVMHYTDMCAVEYPCHAVAIGEDHAKMTKYLEKHYKKNDSDENMIEVAISTLLEAIGREAESSEIQAIVLRKNGIEHLSNSKIDSFLQRIAESQ